MNLDLTKIYTTEDKMDQNDCSICEVILIPIFGGKGGRGAGL